MQYPSDQKSTEPGGPGNLASASVLLIDDDPAVALGLARLLERRGLPVLRAANGRVALALLAQHRVSLVITDVYMEEMDGLETIIELRRRYPELPVIAVSGGSPKIPINCLEMTVALGAVAALEKPFPIETLLELILRHGRGLRPESFSPPGGDKGSIASASAEEGTQRPPDCS